MRTVRINFGNVRVARTLRGFPAPNINPVSGYRSGVFFVGLTVSWPDQGVTRSYYTEVARTKEALCEAFKNAQTVLFERIHSPFLTTVICRQILDALSKYSGIDTSSWSFLKQPKAKYWTVSLPARKGSRVTNVYRRKNWLEYVGRFLVFVLPCVVMWCFFFMVWAIASFLSE